MTENARAGRFGRFGRDVGTTFVRQLFGMFSSLLLAILLARALGPRGNGLFALAVLLPTLLSNLMHFSIGSAHVYFLGRREASLAVAMRASLRIWLAITGAGIAIGLVVLFTFGARLFPGVSSQLLLLSLVAVFPSAVLQSFFSGLLMSAQDFSSYNRTTLIFSILNLILATIAVWPLQWGVLGAVAALAVSQGVTIWLMFRALVGLREREAPRPHMLAGDYLRRCVGYGWKAHLGNILAFLNYRADLYLLNLFLGAGPAGLYVVGVQLSERLWVLAQAASTVLLPKIAHLDGDEQARRALTPFVARWVLLFTASAGIALAIAAPVLVPLVFGESFRPAVKVVLLLLPGVILLGHAQILSNDIAARGRPELNTLVALLVLVLNLAVNFLWIPRFGIAGAAMASSTSYAVNWLLKLFIYQRLSEVGWRATLWPRRSDRAVAGELWRPTARQGA